MDRRPGQRGRGRGPRRVLGNVGGAINATALSAFADQPQLGTRLLTEAWGELELSRIVRPSSIEVLSMLLDVTGAPSSWRRAVQVRSSRGGLLESAPIAKLVARIPMARIADQLRAGRLRGIAISATRVADGAAIVFHAGAQLARAWKARANVVPVASELTVQHVLASAAIPLLFPAVSIDGEAYCDGGLRQMVPLSPAVHLGANRLLVINPLPAVRDAAARAALVSSPLYLAGKALNALFADRVEVDLAQLRRTTAILRAGRRRFGASFDREINAELAAEGGAELHAIDALTIEPSEDLGRLAAEYVAGPKFARRARGPAGHVLRCIAGGDPERMGDLLAYLLFDGGFTSDLIALGREDARRAHDKLVTLFAGADRDRAGVRSVP